MMRMLWLLLAYWRARRQRFATRAQLEQHQQRQLKKFLPALARRSRWFARFSALPLSQWPQMDKAQMMAHFDAMNGAGLRLADVMQTALAAERQRDFRPTIGATTVGLSSGTSAQRGVFAVSAKEQAQWAGILLAKALPDGLFSGARVALFLRANSNLYTTVRSRWLTLEFFDLFTPFDQLQDRLIAYRASIIVAPAQVLRSLALAALAGNLPVRPQRVISVAEVLEPQDRRLIEQAFGTVHEIYQATEGFLGITCAEGVLHLNEEYLHIEPEWLDAGQRRFVPIITDFTRPTQPIVRYRLNDILTVRATPCRCGRVTRALDGVEGRCDDLLHLPDTAGTPQPVFADLLSRALAQALPPQADYRLTQRGPSWLQLEAALEQNQITAVMLHLEQTLAALGIATRTLRWTLLQRAPLFPLHSKRRRIVREVPDHA